VVTCLLPGNSGSQEAVPKEPGWDNGKLLAFFTKQVPCLIGMEACATAHHWGRELKKLGQ
jgi:transposase